MKVAYVQTRFASDQEAALSMFKGATSKFPLGTIPFAGVGWDQRRFLRLGRASWTLKRDGFSEVTVTYRNLEQEKDWVLGPFSPSVTSSQIAEWIADTGDLTPGDWVRLDSKLLTYALDRGVA